LALAHAAGFDRAASERPVWERKVVTIGFTGTYTDDGAESDGIALAGKQSIRFKSTLRLLTPD
jgi:hypothetical protein